MGLVSDVGSPQKAIDLDFSYGTDTVLLVYVARKPERPVLPQVSAKMISAQQWAFLWRIIYGVRLRVHSKLEGRGREDAETPGGDQNRGEGARDQCWNFNSIYLLLQR